MIVSANQLLPKRNPSQTIPGSPLLKIHRNLSYQDLDEGHTPDNNNFDFGHQGDDENEDIIELAIDEMVIDNFEEISNPMVPKIRKLVIKFGSDETSKSGHEVSKAVTEFL